MIRSIFLRHLLSAGLLALALTAAPASAAILSYNTTFSGGTGVGFPTGPIGNFQYDTATDLFTSFDVAWDGLLFHLAGGANAFPAGPIGNLPGGGCVRDFLLGGSACGAGAGQNAWTAVIDANGAHFRITVGVGLANAYTFSSTQPLNAQSLTTGGTVSASAVPEPSSFLLLGLGASLLLLKRHRALGAYLRLRSGSGWELALPKSPFSRNNPMHAGQTC